MTYDGHFVLTQLIQGDQEREGGEGAGVKKAATRTRGAATPSGAFKPEELIVHCTIGASYGSFNH